MSKTPQSAAYRLLARLRNLLASLLLASLLAPTPAQAVATCTAPENGGPVVTTCEWIFLIYGCRNDLFGGGNCSQYAANWVTTHTCYKTWNHQEVWDNACNSNTVPASGDNVILGTKTILTMDANQTVNNFQLNGGCDGYGACQDNYLTLNGYNLTVQGNFTNNSYPEWNCGRYYNGSFGYQTCEANSSSMCEDVCDGHGWTIFNGSSQQTIGGTSATSFTYLEINNAAGVKLTADVTVTGRLKITSGFIDTNGYSLKVYADCSTYPILGSGYVRTTGTGALYLNFQGGGTETCVFPVADSNGQANVTVTKYGTYKGTLKVLTSVTAPDSQTNMGMDLTNNANHYWTLSTGVAESYWSYPALNGATWSTTKPGPAAVSTAVTGLSASATYDVTFQFCATAGTCTLTEKDGAGNTNVASFIMVHNKTAVAGSGKWTKYATPTNSAAASTTAKTTVSGGYGWFNVGVADPGNALQGIYGGIKINWKATGDGGCGTACSKTSAASVLWVGKGTSGTQTQTTHWYGVTVDPGDTWTLTGLGSNIYTIASTNNATCLAKGSGNTYLVMTACSAADLNQQWTILPYSPTGETNGVSLYNANSSSYAHLVPVSGTQELYVDTLGTNWKAVFFLMPPPPPDHFRFEFNKKAALNCQPLDINIKACKKTTAAEAGCTSLYPASITLTPTASKGVFSGLTADPVDTFTGSDMVQLGISAVGDQSTFGYSSASVTPANGTLECWDTSASAAVSCTNAVTFTACSAYFDAVEKTTPVSVKGTNLYTKLAGANFNFDVVGPPGYYDDLTVDLIDVSAGTWACPTAATALPSVAFTAPSAATGVINTTLTVTDPTTFTKRASFTARNDNAVKKVRVRILDGLGNCYNSSDTFTIRPPRFSLTTTPSGATNSLIAGTGSSGTATPFAITATTAVSSGYNGTPTLNQANILDWTGAAITNTPTPTLESTPIPAATVAGTFAAATCSGGVCSSTGNASAGKAFYYSDFGTITFGADAVVDSTFNTDPATDCVSGSTSDTTDASGKYGCSTGSTALATPPGYFRADHYDVNAAIIPNCGTFSYLGRDFSFYVNIYAKNGDNPSAATLNRLDTNYVFGTLPSYGPTFSMTFEDGSTALTVNGTNHFLTGVKIWQQGAYINGTVGTPTTYNIPRTTSLPLQDYESFNLAIDIADPDNATPIYNWMGSALTPHVASKQSNTFPLRFGKMQISNAYGSELLPLYVPVNMLYWQGSSSTWQPNTADSCTTITANNIAISSAFKGSLTGIGITAPTILNGVGSIKVTSTGNKTGSADIAVNLGTTGADAYCGTGITAATAGAAMPWLRGNWCGGAYTMDPRARVNFGGAKSPFLYRREKY